MKILYFFNLFCYKSYVEHYYDRDSSLLILHLCTIDEFDQFSSICGLDQIQNLTPPVIMSIYISIFKLSKGVSFLAWEAGISSTKINIFYVLGIPPNIGKKY